MNEKSFLENEDLEIPIKWHKYISLLVLVFSSIYAGGMPRSAHARQVAQETSQTQKMPVADRYSMVDPDKDVPNDNQREYPGGVNYYFYRHRSKIQADFGQYVTSEDNKPDKEEHRIRLQYQIIF